MTNLNTAARAYALSLDAQCPPSPTESFEAGWEAAQGEIERLRRIINVAGTWLQTAHPGPYRSELEPLMREITNVNEPGEQRPPCPFPELDGTSVDGKHLGPNVWGIGTVSWHPETQDWRCLADVQGCLCSVVVRVTAQPQTSQGASRDASSDQERGDCHTYMTWGGTTFYCKFKSGHAGQCVF